MTTGSTSAGLALGGERAAGFGIAAGCAIFGGGAGSFFLSSSMTAILSAGGVFSSILIAPEFFTGIFKTFEGQTSTSMFYLAWVDHFTGEVVELLDLCWTSID